MHFCLSTTPFRMLVKTKAVTKTEKFGWSRNRYIRLSIRTTESIFGLCGRLQSVLELDDRHPCHGQLTLTVVRVSDNQYHMTLSPAHVSTNQGHAFYYDFSLTSY